MARLVIALGLGVAVLSLTVADSYGAAPAGVSRVNAFTRPATTKDRLPRAWRSHLPGPTDRAVHRPVDRVVRLVASARLASGRTEYLFAYRDLGIKVVLQDGKAHVVPEVCTAFGSAAYAGGDCEPESNLCLTAVCQGLGLWPLEWFTADQKLVLLAGNAITRIEIALRSGTVASLSLPRDRGLIWPCDSNCSCTIDRITAYDGEQVVATDDLVNPETRRPYRC